jgi:hypothetical protein
MQNIATIGTAKSRMARAWLVMIAFTVALLLAVTVADAWSTSPEDLPRPIAGHTECIAETIPVPCS